MENAKRTQTTLAQRRLKPEEVVPEWQRSKEALGDHAAVERLLVETCARLRLPAPAEAGGVWQFNLAEIPAERRALRERLEGQGLEGRWIHATGSKPPATHDKESPRSFPQCAPTS